MNQKGYNDFTSNFLIKEFENIIINITRNQKEVSAITGYDDEQNIIDIPDQILQIVKQDINDSNNSLNNI